MYVFSNRILKVAPNPPKGLQIQPQNVKVLSNSQKPGQYRQKEQIQLFSRPPGSRKEGTNYTKPRFNINSVPLMVQMVRHYVLGCSAYTLLSHRTTKSPANSFVLSSRGHLLCLPSLSKERFPGKCGNSALSLWLCLRKWHSILICSADGHFGWHGMLGIGYPDFPCSLLPMVGKLGLARLCTVLDSALLK